MCHSWLKLFSMACYVDYQIYFKLQGLENSKSFSYYFPNEKCPRNVFAKTDIPLYFLATVWFLLFFPISFFFFSWFKTVFWNATCQEKINVVSNISCFSVSRQIHIGSFILYSLEKGHRLYSVGQVLWLFFNLWNTWGGFRRMRRSYATAMQPTVTVKYVHFFCRVIKNQFATQ